MLLRKSQYTYCRCRISEFCSCATTVPRFNHVTTDYSATVRPAVRPSLTARRASESFPLPPSLARLLPPSLRPSLLVSISCMLNLFKSSVRYLWLLQLLLLFPSLLSLSLSRIMEAAATSDREKRARSEESGEAENARRRIRTKHTL